MNKKVVRSLIIAVAGAVLLGFLLPGDCRNAYRHPEKDVDSTSGQQEPGRASPSEPAPAP